MVATWYDSDPFSFDGESGGEVKANLYFMENDDEVCNDEIDDYDTLQMSMNAYSMILKN